MTHKLIKGGVLDLGLKKKNQEFCLGPKNVFPKNNWGQKSFFLSPERIVFQTKICGQTFFCSTIFGVKKI